MKLELIPNWKAVVLRSHSMRAQAASLIIALILPEALFSFLGYDIAAPQLWWWLALVFGIWGMVGRVVKQKGVSL